ncbi:MAG: hypothetical protein ACJAXY_001035 [Nonlabens sp.]|jgi:hypothetical protein
MERPKQKNKYDGILLYSLLLTASKINSDRAFGIFISIINSFYSSKKRIYIGSFLEILTS